jgi:hypothetical protein
MAQSKAFKRLQDECAKLSKHVRFVRIKHGFYRIFWDHSYLHEVYEDMPMVGYDMEDVKNPRLEDKDFYEEYEDTIDIIRNVKNYVEGYYDAMETIRTRVYMHRNDKEFSETAENAYKTMVVK